VYGPLTSDDWNRLAAGGTFREIAVQLGGHRILDPSNAEKSRVERSTIRDLNHLVGHITAVRARHVNLSLKYSNVTDDDLRLVASIGNLRHLSLNGTDISDAGLRHLGTCQRLEALSLPETNVTEDGLKQLRDLPALKWVMIDDRVTPEQRRRLRQVLPEVDFVVIGHSGRRTDH
jgi:hypothetical protein